MIRRREFITGLGGAAVALWPVRARGQTVGRQPIIGILGPTSPTAQPQWNAAFVPRLRELGWNEGRNVTITSRWAEGRAERLADYADELVQLKVDVIVTSGTAAAVAAKRATAVVPIIFGGAGDPVGTGLVASLSRPGGNATGQSNQQPDTAGKRLELLREIAPKVRRLAIMVNVNAPASLLEKSEVQAMASVLGLDEVAIWEIHRPEDITLAFSEFKGRPEALYVVTDPMLTSNRVRINTLAIAKRLPTIYTFRDNVEAGGLISYGPNLHDQFRRAAEYVDKILRGAKPADIPVEQSIKFDLIINLTTAMALGLDVPLSLQQRADEVIE